MKKYIVMGLCLFTMIMTGCGEKGLKTGTYVCDGSDNDDMPTIYILDEENFSISYVNDPEEAEYTGTYEVKDNMLLLYDIEDYDSDGVTRGKEPTLEFEIAEGNLIYVDITQNRLDYVPSGNEFVLSEE